MRSMTGYSKLTYGDEKYSLNMEIKSVNNKNLNLKIKLPNNLNFLEGIIRTVIASKVKRGSIDIKIDFVDLVSSETFSYDKIQSNEYMNILKTMEDDFNEKFSNKLDILVRNLNVIKKNDNSIEESEYTEFILKKIEELLIPFIKMRETEGENLKKYFIEKINVLEDILKKIKVLKEKVVENYQIKLLERLNSMKEDLEFTQENILKEILIFTDRADISEEISRLESHMLHLKSEIEVENEAIGKKIDFILQEMFREFNTTGVKCNFYEISKLVIEAKNELEKIREQVMNIE